MLRTGANERLALPHAEDRREQRCDVPLRRNWAHLERTELGAARTSLGLELARRLLRQRRCLGSKRAPCEQASSSSLLRDTLSVSPGGAAFIAVQSSGRAGS